MKIQWKDNAFSNTEGSKLQFGKFELNVYKSEHYTDAVWVGSLYFIANPNSQWGTFEMFHDYELDSKDLEKAKSELIKEVKSILRTGHIELNKLK